MPKAKTFTVRIQGWGDMEEQFYTMGVFDTRAKADTKLEECLQSWEDDGMDRADVAYEIEESVVL